MAADGQWRFSSVRRVIEAWSAAVVLLILAPVIATVAVVVRCTLGRPILFREERAGLHGATIEVPKFRTMTEERGSDGARLPDAERLTAVGRRLRSASLDELPQLWSVVRGDMSLVGPRPLPVRYVDRYTAAQRRRLEARPGITGWAQVSGRNSLPWPDKLALDVWWIDHASAWLDLRILVLTAVSLVRRDGVNAADHATMPEFMGEQ